MVKKTTMPRKTLAEKLADAEMVGFRRGVVAGRAEAGNEFLPNWHYKAALIDLVRTIESWPIDGSNPVMLIGTDLKHICNAAIPARTAKAVATELKRLGYNP